MARRRQKQQSESPQYVLDFESQQNERFAMLISALDNAAANEKVRSLVLLVWNFTKGSDQPLRRTLGWIGDQFHRSRDTARRWLREAHRLGLVTVVERRRTTGGQQSHELAIDWPGVQSLARRDRGSKTAHRGGNLAQRHSNLLPPIRNTILSSIPNSIPPPTSPPPDAGSGWRAVVEEVYQLGVNQAAAAIQSARSRGASIAAIRDLVTHWTARRRHWTHPEAVLKRRIDRWQPDQSADSDWPPPDNVEAIRAEGARLAQARRDQELAAQLARREEGRRRRAEARRQHLEQTGVFISLAPKP